MKNETKGQVNLILRGVAHLINRHELVKKIENATASGIPLNIKLGVDPTAPDIHLGHTVVFRKLRHFQDLGHNVFFLIGDFTARIGDPSGRDKTRPPLTEEQVLENAQTYLNQISKILDKDKTTVVYNSHWLKNMTFEDVVKMAAQSTMAKLLEHNTFRQRFESGESIRMNEFLYPFMQGYDSVALKADVELGGTDQTFNLTFGRDLQKFFGQEPQVCITMPILTGTDGKQKMSKSLGNYIGIDEPAPIMFEKIMRMNDKNIPLYFTLLTDIKLAEIKEMKAALKKNPLTSYILDIKKRLAFEIVKFFHDESQAIRSLQGYGNQMVSGMPEFSITKLPATIFLVDLIKELFLLNSKNESRTLIKQGAVTVSGEKLLNPDLVLKLQEGMIVKAGKSRIVKLTM
ncbi:MAG: tyrosine--tRNA ligase [Bacteroidales bacterium]|nr:tyrosine--tRNA ligase [Bacteroidales bacterium]